MAKLSVDQTLSKAKSYARKGEIEEAQKLYQNVLQAFPKNGRAQKGLDDLRQHHAPTTTQNPPQELLQRLLGHYQNGRFSDAEKLAVFMTQEFPRHQFAWKVLGAVLGATGRSSEAADANQTAVALSPKDAAAHNNLGNTLKELGRFDDAVISYKRAIALKPDFAMAYSNLGNTLKELGRLDEAETSYNQAIALKPDYAEAHYNLGNTLKELERFEDAETSYTQAIALKPDFAEAQNNLVNLFTISTSQKESPQPIVKVDQEIKEINFSDVCSEALSNGEIVDLFHKASNIIEKHGLNIATDLSQTYRRDLEELNCERHMQIFNKFNVIPEFCFGCYKVQIEPRSVIELIKLFVLFDQITLSNNNIRKCMIEMRPEVAGFYKGLIYCSSLGEAYEIADYLAVIVKKRFGSELSLAVKRGCSEYSNAFADYNKINRIGPQEMNYNPDWKPIEDDYDLKNPIKYEKIVWPSLSGLSLSDVLIMRNWIDYAKGIEDSSAQLLGQNGVVSHKVYKIAKSRVEKYPWRESAWVTGSNL